jgi:1-acyl-sn-glycerol-3-phosphate acyltransferase
LFRKKAIDEWALDYWLLQRYAKLCFRIYYRKITVINRHNIPLNQPVILAPNHQNALMDAMVLVCNTPFQNVFLARADIFKGKRLIKFLTFANIMPIYRIRDGIENVKRNDVVFEKTLRVLHNKNYPLGLFAEGNHGDKRRLRQLVKGLFRIAFLAQEKFGDKQGVKIVPIGIDYGHYQHFRTTLFMNIGKPIEVSEFYGAYCANPVLAINQLKDAFAVALSRLMIDIQTEEYYDLYMYLREMFNDEMRTDLGIQENSLSGR